MRSDETKPLNPNTLSQPHPRSSAWRSTWLSVYIVSALSFISSAQYTMYFTTLWPYLQKLDVGVSESFFGYIVAIYSAGQIISSPLFGYWSNHIRQVRLPIIVGMIFMFGGNVIYLIMEYVRNPGTVLLFSRFITGMGSGNIVLMRSYAATAVEEDERTRALTFVTCGQAVGLTIGPALQLIFTFPIFEYPGFSIPLINLNFNVYTASTIISNLMNFIGTCAMMWCFNEKFTGTDETEVKDDNKQPTLPPYDLIALSVCLITRFTYMFINTNLETIGSPYSMMMFAWNAEAVIFYTSFAQGVVGLFTLLVYVVLIFFKLDRRINYRIGSMIGLSVMILFHLVTFSWPFLSHNVTPMNKTGNTSAGCDEDKFYWCKDLTHINVWFYYTSYCLALGLAFPILNIGNTSLYSAILGPRRQGIQQGILQMFGGAARLVGPITVSLLYSHYGPRIAWIMEIVVIFSTLMLWFIFFNRIVPLQQLTPMDSFHKVSVVDVAPDPSALSSSSQVHSVLRKTRSDHMPGSSDPISYNSYIDPPKQCQTATFADAASNEKQLLNNT